MVQTVQPFQMIEPYGEREEGDFGIYPVPADTPEPEEVADPKASAELVEESSPMGSQQVPPPPQITPPALVTGTNPAV